VTRVGNATHINRTEAQKERARLIMEPFCYDTAGQRLQGWRAIHSATLGSATSRVSTKIMDHS
jgi:hypothetical protein